MGCQIMGRPPKSFSCVEGRHSHYESEARKTKHRYADTKYRSKVQFLYGKVKEMVKVKTTKDALLNDALKFILSKENEICKVIGESNMKECKEEFLRFLYHEEMLWKSEKDIGRWWSKVRISLNSKYSIQEPVNDENAGFDSLCYEHSKKWASHPSEFRSSADYAPYPLNEPTKHKCSMLIEGIDYTNDSLSCNASTLSNSSKENLKDPMYTPNSMWSPTDTLQFVSKDSKGCIDLSGKVRNEFISPDTCFYSMENPLEMPESQELMDDSRLNDSGFVSSTFLNL